MPGVESIPEMNHGKGESKKESLLSWGQRTTSRHTEKAPYTVHQNCDEFKTVLICAGAYMKITAQGSTLASSLAFTGAVDEADTEYGDWVAGMQGSKPLDKE